MGHHKEDPTICWSGACTRPGVHPIGEVDGVPALQCDECHERTIRFFKAEAYRIFLERMPTLGAPN